MRRSSIGGGDNSSQDIPLSLYCYILLHTTLTYTNQPKALVTSRRYHYHY